MSGQPRGRTYLVKRRSAVRVLRRASKLVCMSNLNERGNTPYLVLKALYDLTEESKRLGVMPMPSRGEMSRRTRIEEDEVAEALSFLTQRGLARDEEFGPDGPTYSITEQGVDEIDGMAAELSEDDPGAREERQPLIRDMELVRALLLYIANTAGVGHPAPQPSAEGYSDEVVAYHLSIMQEAGLIRGSRSLSGKWSLSPLTWEGQEFMNAAKDDSVWNSVKKNAGGLFNTVTIAVAKDLLIMETRRRLGLDGTS